MRWGVLIGLLLLAGATPAEVYRWTDDQGRVHYGERPPGPEARRIELPPSTTSPVETDREMARRRALQKRLLDSYAYERDRKAAEAVRDAEAQRTKAERCQSLRRRWRRLSYAGPIYFPGPNGQRDYLSEERRATEKQRLRPAYKAACGELPD